MLLENSIRMNQMTKSKQECNPIDFAYFEDCCVPWLCCDWLWGTANVVVVIVNAPEVEVGVAVGGVVDEVGSELDLVPSIPSEVDIWACNCSLFLDGIIHSFVKFEPLSVAL